MNETETILLYILSGALAVFLILAIVLTVKAIQLVNQMKQIAARAEALAENVEQTAAMFSKAAGPLAVIKAVGNMADYLNKQRSKRQKED